MSTAEPDWSPHDAHEITWRMLPEGEPRVIEDIRDAQVLREGDLFLLTDSEGNVPVDNRSGFGLYHSDTRYVSAWDLIIIDLEPVVLLSTAALGFGQEQVMTNPELRNARGEVLRSGSIEIRRQRIIDQALLETLRVTNYSPQVVRLSIRYEFDADFADLFELRGIRREQRGRLLHPRVQSDRVTLAHRGLDEKTRRAHFRFDPVPAALDNRAAVFNLEIRPGAVEEIAAAIAVDQPGGPGTGSSRGSTAVLARQYQQWLESSTNVSTNNDLFNLALERSLSDLRMLWSQSDGHYYPSAGVPWFDALFGRDSALAALMVLAFRPEIAREVLLTLASFQGAAVDPWREEEPGKIVHEVRHSETANTGEVVFGRYFGSIDSTPLFLLLAAEYFSWTGDLELMRQLKPSLLSALDWLARFADIDGDGFAEYKKKSAGGLDNQGWKDSWDGIIDAHGDLLRPPIALVEVQGYIYAAKHAIAGVMEQLGDSGLAQKLRQEAAVLRRRINEVFWLDDGFYALALDGGKQPAKVLTSNAGQLLWTGVPTRDRAGRQIERLMHNDMYSGWGLRTLSRSSSGYNPLGYHKGTVWPHDNALILAGFKRYGAEAELNEIATGLCDAAFAFPYLRLPELFSGSSRTAHHEPVPYPVACRPQAFAAATLPMVLTSILGLVPDAPGGRLYIVRPRLPHWLEEVRVVGLRVGHASVDLEFKRRGSRTSVEVLGKSGRVDVIRTANWPAGR
jgi:glycogen debranching enzyme